jgi:hypothetical protein
MTQTKKMLVNGRYYPMWQGLIERKEQFVQIINVDMGATARAKLLDIRLEPSGSDMAIVTFDVVFEGEKSQWGATVDHLGITANNTEFKGLCLSSPFVGEFVLQTKADLE